MSASQGGAAAGLPQSPISFVAHFASPYRMLFFGSLAAAVLSGILGLAPAIVVYLIVKAALSGDAAGFGVAAIAVAGLAAMLGHLAFAALTTLCGHKTAFAIQRDMRNGIVERLRRAPVNLVEGRAGEIKKTAMGDVDRLEGILAHVMPDVASGLAALAAGAAVMIVVDWRLFLAAIALLPVALMAQVWTYRGRPELFERWSRTEARANAALLSYVRGIATLRAFNRQASTLENVRSAIHELRDLAVSITRKSCYSYSLFNSVLATNLIVVMPVALLLNAQGSIDAAGFVLAVTLGASLVAPLNKVVFATMIAARSSVAVSRIGALLGLPEMPDGASGKRETGGTIRLENVSFTYPDGRTVLKSIDLEIPEGETVAVVGPSGAGKSTLARLLLRLEDPTSGTITIGGEPMREIALDRLRAGMSAVFQDSVLFHGTIDENVRMARPAATAQEVGEALALANAAGIAGDAAATLEARISDRGQRLSGGEKQRIAIARAVLKNAPFLLLDEATASVDAESEAAIQDALAKMQHGRTVVVIAHRLNSVRDADRIVVLNAGEVEAVGKHADLLVVSPTYRRLHEAQQRSAEWNLGGR